MPETSQKRRTKAKREHISMLSAIIARSYQKRAFRQRQGQNFGAKIACNLTA
jgi:hypothetical protein